MNTRRQALMLALLFSLSLVIGFVAPTTLAYIAGRSPSLLNTFVSPYFTPDTSNAVIAVRKTVYNTGENKIGPEGFQFLLENLDNHENMILTADANGDAGVILPFSDADAGKTYTYRLTEINDKRENVVYSDQEYVIEISVEVNTDNQVVANTVLNGVPVETILANFANTYLSGGSIVSSDSLPLTGDSNMPLLYLALMLLSGGAMLVLVKRRCTR